MLNYIIGHILGKVQITGQYTIIIVLFSYISKVAAIFTAILAPAQTISL